MQPQISSKQISFKMSQFVFLLIILLFYNRFAHAHLTNIILSCEKSSCEDSTNVCDILCKLPSSVKFDDSLIIEQVVGISSNEIKSTKLSLSIDSVRMTKALPENIGNAMANFQNFQKISITHSNLKSIKQTDFVHMKTITELDLSNNQIEVIPNGVFDNLTQLEILSIHDNRISYLPSGTLNMLIHLKDFYAQFNRIEEIHSNFFGNNRLIERIYLQNNKLVSINEQFDQLTHLNLVDLRGNADFCDCKVIDPDESEREKKDCEKEKLNTESEWKKTFINCSMDKVLIMDTVTIGPCALNEAIRMVTATLQFQNCMWDYEEIRQSSNTVENCSVPRRIEEQNIWIEFDACVSEQVKLHSQLNQLLQSCYDARNSSINQTSVDFKSCMMCTNMSDIHNVRKCELRYVKDNGDTIHNFQGEVVRYFANKADN